MPGTRVKETAKKLPVDKAYQPSHTYVSVPHSPRPTRDVPIMSYEDYDSTVETPAIADRNRRIEEEKRLLDEESRAVEAELEAEDEESAYARDAAARRARLAGSSGLSDLSAQSGYLEMDKSTPISTATTGANVAEGFPPRGVPRVAAVVPPTGAGENGSDKSPSASDQMLVMMTQLLAKQAEQTNFMFNRMEENAKAERERVREEKILQQRKEEQEREERRLREDRDREERQQEKREERQSFLEAMQTNSVRDAEARCDRDRLAEKKELRTDLLKGLGNYKEGSHMVGYITKFERLMTDCSISEESWIERLSAHMPERLSARMSQFRGQGATYDAVKEDLLLAVGENAQAYGFKLFDTNYERLKSQTPNQLTEWVERVSRGVVHGAKSVEDCVVLIATAYTRQFMPHDGRAFLRTRTITTMRDLVIAIEEWMSSRQEGNLYRPRVSGVGSGASVSSSIGSNSSQYKSSQSESQVRGSHSAKGSGNGNSNKGQDVCFHCNDPGHKAFECPKNECKRRKVTCYNCKKEGHYANDCKEKKGSNKGATPKLSQLRAGKVSSRNTVSGLVNGVSCDILIDSGADIALVPRSLVGHDVVECGTVKASGAYGGADAFCSTKVVLP